MTQILLIEFLNEAAAYIKSFISQGQKVKAGDKAVQFDSKLIKEKGYPLTTMLIVSENPENLDIQFKENTRIEKSVPILK